MSVSINLKKPRYGENILKTLNDLRKEQRWSDFMIETSTGLVSAHRVVLAAAQNLHIQSKGFPLGEVSTFSLREYSKETVESFVSYLYTGDLKLDNKDQIDDFLKLCQTLKFTDLLKHKAFKKYKDSCSKSDKTKDTCKSDSDFSEDVSNIEDLSEHEEIPHPVYLTEHCDGKMIVKKISKATIVHSKNNKSKNSKNESESESHETLNDNTANDDYDIEEVVVKREVLDSESDNEDNQFYNDEKADDSDNDNSDQEDSNTENETSETAKQDNETGLKMNQNLSTKSLLKNTSKRSASSALGSESQSSLDLQKDDDKYMAKRMKDEETNEVQTIPQKRTLLTNAERQQKFRANLKKDPELYKAHRAYETARVHAFRQAMTNERKIAYNEKTRIRMQKYRDKIGAKESSAPKEKKKKTTPAANEKQKAEWRNRKRLQRKNMSSQKKGRINERRRQLYALQKIARNCGKKQTNMPVKSAVKHLNGEQACTAIS